MNRARKIDRAIAALILLQWLLALAWSPFSLIANALRWLGRQVQRLGDVLIQPLYWGVLRAKRKRLGEPLWQEHDWRIGIGPPCAACGEHVPPERHREGCVPRIEATT